MSVRYFFAPFQRPLKTPFIYGNKKMGSRPGIYLKRVDSEHTYYSEASPLEGHSIDTFEQALSFLSSIKKSALEQRADSAPPSVQMAITGLNAQLEFSKKKYFPVKSNALLSWEGTEKTFANLEASRQHGYDCFKLKVGPAFLRDIPAFLHRAIKAFPKITFRLDANQSLDPKSLDTFFAQTKDILSQIEYIEEPFLNWHESNWKSPIAIAADESIFQAAERADVWIWKPMVQGTFPMSPKKKTIITSCLETEAGRRSLLAHLLTQPQSNTAGISTGFLFAQNFLADAATISDLPPISLAEMNYYENLEWKEIR